MKGEHALSLQPKIVAFNFQVRYMEQLVQSHLVDNGRPLHDLYTILHSLCQSLQVSQTFILSCQG